MSETISVLIDYGNSETRFYVLYGKHVWYKTLANQYAKMTQPMPPEYCNSESTSFRVDGVTYAQGAFVARERSMQAKRPNSLQKKMLQPVTLYTTNLVLIYALLLVSKYKNCAVEDLDATFCLGLLLPAAEHNRDAEAFKTQLMSVTHLSAVTPVAFEKDIAIDRITIVPEGAAAYMAAIYMIDANGNCVLRPENAQFVTGDLLVLDIGAGTTDIVQMQDGDLVLSSKDTLHKGGRNIESACRQQLEAVYEYRISDNDMRSILQTGTFMQGNTQRDATDILNQVKDDFSQELYNYLIEYIERHNIEPRALKGLLVVGGGALPTVRDDVTVSPKIADILVNYICGLTNTISLVDTSNCDPRKLNIEGLRMFFCAQA